MKGKNVTGNGERDLLSREIERRAKVEDAGTRNILQATRAEEKCNSCGAINESEEPHRGRKRAGSYQKNSRMSTEGKGRTLATHRGGRTKLH